MLLDRLFRRHQDQPIIGYKRFLSKREGRALLAYLVEPVRNDRRSDRLLYSNRGIARAWPKILNQLGFEVDIINWDDQTFRVNHHYDLVILHGARNARTILSQLPPATPIVLFATGSYWRFHNRQERRRLSEFRQRHGVSLAPDRLIQGSEEEVLEASTGIISLGGRQVAETYGKFPHVYSLNIGSYLKVDPASLRGKDYSSARRNFLFYAGWGSIHKGLDLLIDAFLEMPELNLFVASRLNEDMEAFYQERLKDAENIKFLGIITPLGPVFREMVRTCAFLVLPSCSEGSPGSVVDMMHQGLVPILTHEAGLDIEEFGILLDDVSVEGIRDALRRASSTDPAKLRKQADATLRAAQRDYSAEQFESRLAHHISSILYNAHAEQRKAHD